MKKFFEIFLDPTFEISTIKSKFNIKYDVENQYQHLGRLFSIHLHICKLDLESSCAAGRNYISAQYRDFWKNEAMRSGGDKIEAMPKKKLVIKFVLIP